MDKRAIVFRFSKRLVEIVHFEKFMFRDLGYFGRFSENFQGVFQVSNAR